MNQGSCASDATSLTLLAMARDGQEDGWQQLAELYAPLIAKWGRQKQLSSADVDDLIQEVFASLVTAMNTYDPEKGRFRGFLYTITERRVVDILRRSGREQSISGYESAIAAFDDDESPPSQDALIFLFQRGLDMLQRQSNPRTWQMFEQTMLRNRTPTEVADELGVKVNTVIKGRLRLCEKLRGLLADELPQNKLPQDETVQQSGGIQDDEAVDSTEGLREILAKNLMEIPAPVLIDGASIDGASVKTSPS